MYIAHIASELLKFFFPLFHFYTLPSLGGEFADLFNFSQDQALHHIPLFYVLYNILCKQKSEQFHCFHSYQIRIWLHKTLKVNFSKIRETFLLILDQLLKRVDLQER